MKTTSVYYFSLEQMIDFIKTSSIEDSPSLLIQIFTAKNERNFILKLTTFFHTHFPLCALIGCTTDGEIKDGHVSTGQTVISFSQFEKTKLQVFITDSFKDYFQAGKLLATTLTKKDTKAIISFIDGLHGNGEEYLNGIHSVCNQVIVAGGLAGDNAKFEKTYLFTKDFICDKGVVGVSLNSSCLHIFSDFSFDWQAIGKTLTITKADKNRVYMIEDKTATEAYTYYLGENIGIKLPSVAIEFPLIIQKNGLNIARAAISKKDDGSLVFAGNFNEGDKVRFGCANFESILNETQAHINKLLYKEVETLFIYSCMARRRFMPNEIECETMPYNEVAPASGFYTYGEFFSTLGNQELLNQSMTVLALSESDTKNEKQITVDDKMHNNTTIQALSHLINISTKELDKVQKELELLSTIDPLTKLYNRRYFTDVSDDMFKISQRDSTNISLLMLDIDKFKNINDTFGHKVGDDVLVQFAIILRKLLRKSDITCRFGGEEFVVLLPQTIAKDGETIAQKIRKTIEETPLRISTKHEIRYTVSIGVSQIDFIHDTSIDKALNRADNALYFAKNNGRNQVVLASDFCLF
jgi:diguanylate cyclase (GGDEF)-like protein